jgi:hypothetical protein
VIDITVLISDTASAPPRRAAAAHARVLLAPARHHLDIVRHLADRRAHVALRHAVRAAEIQFHAVTAGVFHARQDALPTILGARHHQADHHGTIRPVALDLLDLVEIHL